MRRLRRQRQVVAVFALGVAVGGALTFGAPGPRAQEEPAVFAVTSSLPAWRAPGGVLVVQGTAGPGESITFFFGPRSRTSAAAADGTFRLTLRAPAVPGLYPVAVEAARDPIVRLELGFVRVRALRIRAVGDVNLGDRVARAIATYGTRYPWLSVAPVLRPPDLTIANLECAVSTRGAPVPKEFTFRGSPASLRTMASYAGVDVVSVANNHSLDYGRLAFADTLYYARAYGMKTIGGGRNLAAARRPAIYRLGGLRVALLGYSDVRPPGFDAGPTTSGTAPAFPAYVAADVREARADGAAVVVVYFHWGIERTFTPTSRQRSLAQTAFTAGATVVVGAHPHVLQPIEQPRAGRLVAWSLGNFVFGANTPGTARTGVLQLRVSRAGVLSYGFRRARIGGVFGIQPQLL